MFFWFRTTFTHYIDLYSNPNSRTQTLSKQHPYKENVFSVVEYNIIHISNVIFHNKMYNVPVISSWAMAADINSHLNTIGQLVSLA